MAEDRQWYPADWVDEACPPAKSTPDEFIVADAAVPTGYRLGYADDDDGLFGDEREVFNQALAIGDVVDFMCCDRFDDMEAELSPTGECRLLGEIPPGHNSVMINGDIDTLHESFDDLIAALRDPCEDLDDYIFDPDDVRPETVTLSFARWSDRLPHQFGLENGKPTFRQVPAAKAMN